MNNYTEIEQACANRLLEMETALFPNKANWNKLEIELHKMYLQIPSHYENEFEGNEKWYYKFWNQEDFTNFIEYSKPLTQVIWLLNAFPKCCYLLSIIQIEKGLFNDAKITLERGLILEPDSPFLLNEMGLLFCSIAQSTKSQYNFLEASKYYQRAFTSRPYNSNKLKAASLRGIGYCLVELNDLNFAEEVYLNSLKLEENENARNGLDIIYSIKISSNKSVITSGTNYTQVEEPDSMKYFYEQLQLLPSELQNSLPSKYVYIWTKASRYLTKGNEVYRAADAFQFPLKEWSLDEISAGANQITHHLKGITPNHCIVLTTLNDVKNLLLTFHFEIAKTLIFKNSSNQEIYKIDFSHKVEVEENTTLYFQILCKEQEKKWKKFW